MKAMTMFAAAGAALAAGCTMNEEPALTAEAQGELAGELANYSPDGAPVSCVSMRELHGNRSIHGDVVLFTGTAGRRWVNRAQGSCPLDDGRALQFRTTQTRLCSGDSATVFDPATGIQYGGCTLGEFQPYRRNR